jgi:hypothetical protein
MVIKDFSIKITNLFHLKEIEFNFQIFKISIQMEMKIFIYLLMFVLLIVKILNQSQMSLCKNVVYQPKNKKIIYFKWKNYMIFKKFYFTIFVNLFVWNKSKITLFQWLILMLIGLNWNSNCLVYHLYWEEKL